MNLSTGQKLWVGPFLLIVGGIFSLAAAGMIVEYLDSADWPAAEGNITRLSIEIGGDPENLGSCPHVEYDFRVGNRAYHGNRRQFVRSCYGDRRDAVNIVRSYRIGQPVLVYYDPEHPERNVLLREIDWTLAIISVTAFVIGVALIMDILGYTMDDVRYAAFSVKRQTTTTTTAYVRPSSQEKSLNVHKDPDVHSRVIATAERGETYTVIGRDALMTWWALRVPTDAGTKIGWIEGTNLDVSDPRVVPNILHTG